MSPSSQGQHPCVKATASQRTPQGRLTTQDASSETFSGGEVRPLEQTFPGKSPPVTRRSVLPHL